MEAAVISLAIFLVIFIIISIVLAVVVWRCRVRNLQLNQDLEMLKSQPSGIKQINSLPCRLKKSKSQNNNTNTTSATSNRSESGVYDMTSELGVSNHSGSSSSEQSSNQIIAMYATQNGKSNKIILNGEIYPVDIITVRHALCQFINTPNTEQKLTEGDSNDSQIVLDDIIISGLNSQDFCYDNESFVKDEETTPNTNTSKKSSWKSHPVARSLSSIAKRRKQKNKEARQLSRGSITELASLYEAQMCVYKVSSMSQSGGEICLEGGVSLTIPTNCLSERKEIALGVSFNDSHLPKLEDGQTLLSPIVFCQPSGVQFKQPTVLKLPHCALNIQSDWKIMILKSQTDVDEAADWSVLQIGEYESRTVNKTNIEIELTHFTMYCIIGQPKPRATAHKMMKVHVLSLPVTDQIWTPHIYIVNKYTSDKQLSSEEQHSQTLMVTQVDEKPDVLIRLEEYKDSTLFTNSTKTLLMSDLWNTASYHVNYEQKVPAESVSDIQYRFTVQPINERYGDYILDLCLDQAGQPVNSNSIIPLKSRSVFPETMKWDIILMLDQQCYESDWRQLAKEMNLSSDIIQVLEAKPSPTKELLRIWQDEHHGCIRSFVAVCVKIKRFDVAEKIEEHVGPLYLETLTNHKCNEHC